MVELLAPAGDMKSFDAAIACGANAVYLGLGNFNARMKAQNFGTDSLRDVVKRAHFFGVKVYVTVNTILQNSELNELFSLVKAAIEAKADAFLVQDIGVCKLLKESFEGIVLHASTQMGVHNLEGAKMAQKMGITRVVLSRETTLEDIKAIKANTSLELEYFVQGALCVCFSGECYMSSLEQGASGNRGLCKQLCRLPYEARVGDVRRKGYFLSARDLCLAESIRQLKEAGITSFKIEGRMRREGYVAKAVSVYRKFVQGEESKLSPQDKFSLQTAFSRGNYLERAYLDGGTPSVVEPRFNGHIGADIGEVEAVRPFKKDLYEATLRLKYQLHDGDGLKFLDGDVEVASLGVGGVRELGKGRYAFVTSTPLRAGWRVRLTLDRAEEEQLLSGKRLLPIKMCVTALKGEPLEMRAECDVVDFDGERRTVRAEARSKDALEAAANSPMSEDALRAQAEKTSYAGFVSASCEVRTDGVFAPISVVNSVRRELLQRLADGIIAVYEEKNDVRISAPSDCLNFENSKPAQAAGALKTVFSEDMLEGVSLRKGEIAVLAPSEYTADEVKRMCSALDLTPQEVALKLPPLARGKDISMLNALLDEVPVKTLVAHNLYGLSFAERGYRVIAGEGMNIANHLAALEATSLGAYGVVPSLEFADGAREIAAEIGDENAKNDIWGEKTTQIRVFSSDCRHPLMTLAHCPYKTIFGNECAKCSYKSGLTLSREKRTYAVRRVRMSGCLFELYPSPTK